MNSNEGLWDAIRRIRYEIVARQRWEWEASVPSGSPMLAGFMWTHTLSTRIEYDPVVSKWPPDLYPSRFKGSVTSAEIEVLTATLDSFSLTLF